MKARPVLIAHILGPLVLLTVVMLTGCATSQPPAGQRTAAPGPPAGTPAEQLREIATRVTREYSRFLRTPAIVIEPRWDGVQSTSREVRVGGVLLAGTRATSTPPLTSIGAAGFAHELSHVVLRHHTATQCIQVSTRYLCERDANVEAVRVSTIAWGLTHAQAVALIDAKMLDTVAGKLAGETLVARDPGHKHPCLEARDFRTHFRAHFPAEVSALPVMPGGCATVTE